MPRGADKSLLDFRFGRGADPTDWSRYQLKGVVLRVLAPNLPLINETANLISPERVGGAAATMAPEAAMPVRARALGRGSRVPAWEGWGWDGGRRALALVQIRSEGESCAVSGGGAEPAGRAPAAGRPG